MRFSGSVKLRPVRMALLASPEDMDSVRRFMRLSTCVWGGRYSPIVPFFDETPERWLNDRTLRRGLDIARGYIDFFEPDLVIETSPGMADRLGWKKGADSFQFSRVVAIEDFFEVDDRGRVEFAAAVDVFDVLVDLYEKEYRFERRHKSPFALFDPNVDAGAFFEAVAGTYPNDEALKHIPDGYRDVFAPAVLPATPESYLTLMNERYRNPHWVTRHGLEESLDGSRELKIFVFDPTDTQDLIDIWNYRLIQRDVLPVNVHWFPECSEFLRKIIAENYRPLPGNPSGIMIRSGLTFGTSVDENTARALTEAHLSSLAEGSFYWSRYYENIPDVATNRERWRTRKIVATAKSASFDEETNQDGYVKVPTLAPEFHNKARTYSRTVWINVIQPSGSRLDDKLANVFPSNLWDPRYPRLLTGDQVTITREGWVTPRRHDLGHVLMQPMTGRDAFVGWFEEQGIQASPSDAGQVADQVISAAGSLLACGMFADRETVDLLNSMAESYSATNRGNSRVLRKTPDKTKHYNAIQNHFRDREQRSWGFWSKLDYFLERSVFRAGLRIKCPNCASYNWYDLKTIDFSLVCSRCLKEFPFNQSPDHLRKADWFYRVIGPFATPDYAQGGYAVALTLRRLAEEAFNSELTWSTGLELKPLNVEIDFAAWYRRESLGTEPESDEPVQIVGEAKSFGKDAIEAKDVDGLKAVGEQLPGAVLVISTLKTIDDFTDDELALITGLARWGRERRLFSYPRNPVVILTGVELLSEGHIKQAWEDVGGRAAQLVQHASVSLDHPYTLSELTQMLYLDLPPFREDLQQQAESHS